MARGPRYRVAFRRRRANITDFRMRKTLILSGIPRLVVRLSLKYVYAQLTEAVRSGDRVLASACSRELTKFGWRAPCRNTPTAYLTGFLLGQRALALGVEAAILDIGLRRSSIGARIFAVLKGAVDVGLKIPYGERILPSQERIKGEHIASYSKMLLEEDRQSYERMFSQYLSKGLAPEQLADHFVHVLNAMKSD